MLYETYKLGKIKKNPVHRFYTREELESYELKRLREICHTENIKPPAMEILYNKKKLAEFLYNYLGIIKKDLVYTYSEEGCKRLEKAFEEGKPVEQDGTGLPVCMEIYKGQDLLGSSKSSYIITSQMENIGEYVFLADETGRIQAILTAKPDGRNKYKLDISKERMSPDIPIGYFHGWRLYLMETDTIKEAVRRYLGKYKKRNVLQFACYQLPEVIVKEVPVSGEPLVIDFGASYTTAKVYSGTDRQERISFQLSSGCGSTYEENHTWHSLCPSIIAIKECSSIEKEHLSLLFGKEALQETRKYGFITRNSIFYNIKQWVSCYHEKTVVIDMEGNTCEVEKLFLIRQFLLYIIHQAEQQNRTQYKKICFTCPVKQKLLFMSLYKEALPEYTIISQDIADEAVAVLYHCLENSIHNMDYEDGVFKKALVLDCGGGTSDMAGCSYQITNEGITSRLDINVAFAHGDTNFGGNHLTWRVFQFLKIRMAEFYTNSQPVPIDMLFPGIFPELYETVDREGAEKAYGYFSDIYDKAEFAIPSRFADYRNWQESFYLKAKGNFYFLWNMAEAVKIRLFDYQGIYRLPLCSLFAGYGSEACFPDFYLSIQKDADTWETNTICPGIVIEKEEINLLLKPDIYAFLKNFIEPLYENGQLMDIDHIILSGQSSKIGLFREILKEYVAGRKAKPIENKGFARKLICIDGAFAYQKDKKTGRIRADIIHEAAKIPYSLSAEDYKIPGHEIVLLEKGTFMGQVYGFLSRPQETEEVLLYLRDGTGKKVYNIPFLLRKKDYIETGYETLSMDYPFLKQEDLDSIKNGELRLFVFADNENWGFGILETTRTENLLYSCPAAFVPFEKGAWETDFFDGRH